MQNLIEFFENHTNKKINILKYNNQPLNNNENLVTFNNKTYIIEINDKFTLNNINGYFYLFYQHNLDFENLKGVLNNLYGDSNIFEYEKYLLLNSKHILDIDYSTPEIIESETYSTTYIAYLGNIDDIEVFNFKISILNELTILIDKGNSIKKYITTNDLFIHNAISLVGKQKELSNLIDFELIKNIDENLLQTGLSFIENELNISKTSSSLFLHRNTLIYRLEKIKEILGLDLKIFKDSFIFYLSINSYFLSKS